MALALTSVLMLADFAPLHVAATPAACPKGLDIVARDPEAGFGVLDLPGGYENGNAAMMLSACHGRAIVQGETSRRMGVALKDRLETRDLAAQKRQLTGARVKYILLHAPRDGLFRWRAQDGSRLSYPQHYRTVHQGDGLTVLQVY